MIIKKAIDGEIYRCSTSAADFFTDDFVKQYNAGVCMEIMRDCLDTIYSLVVKSHPRVFKPVLYLADSETQNAFAVEGKCIVVTSGLIFAAANLIQKRYTQELLTKYDLLKDYSHGEVLSYLRIYLWRFIILHELYHIWDGHYFWQRKYQFNKYGQLIEKLSVSDPDRLSESENSDEIRRRTPASDPQFNLTQQAMELDADSAAVCMLINLLMMDTEARAISNKNHHIKNHMAFIFGALSTTFCLFDGNSGARFEILNKLMDTTHPIPAIRLVYAEEIADAILHHYFPAHDELREVESEWQRILCDIEPEQEGRIDMGQVFYFTAHTEKAQRHLCTIKHRMCDMHDTLSQFILGNHADKLCENEMSFIPESVWFTDDGISTKGWTNPATGQQSAIKAKQKPLVKAVKIGRNDPCPCGSGLKFKKCTCIQYHPQ